MTSPIGDHIERLVIGERTVLRARNLRISMRDGIRLAADLYLPTEVETGARFPVVMEYIPYRKDDVNLAARRHNLYLPQHGYIFARVDVRGTGMSEGISTDEYLLQEQEDGCEVIAWIARQPWCDGQVNMMGISYGGFTALQVAAHNPPQLTSIIPVDFTDDRYTDDCHYRGGLMRLYYDVAYYGGFMVVWNAMPPDARFAGEDWSDIWQAHLDGNEPYLLQWYRHQTDGAYWRQGSVGDRPERIRCPVFMIGGWRDGYMNPPLRLYESLRGPKKVWIGPWNHAMPDSATPGPRVDHLVEILRWLDYWCKGKDTGIMDEPPVVVYEQSWQPPVPDRLETEGRWRAEVSWPVPAGHESVFYLDRGGLTDTMPTQKGYQHYPYVPTTGTAGGLFSGGIQFGLAGDQRSDEVDALVYTSAPLTADLCILGQARIVLFVSSTAPVMGFATSLCEVAPDGRSHLVAKGMLNGTRRDSLTDPQPMVAGEIYELAFGLDGTAWRFSKGNRIGLVIASADWPNVWPTPYPGTNRVFHGPRHPSALTLPVVPATGSAAAPSFEPSPLMPVRHANAVRPPVWQVCDDLLTGRKTVRIRLESSYRTDADRTVEREASSEFSADPADPSQASAWGHHRLAIREAGRTIAGVSDISILGTRDQFQMVIDVRVDVNGAAHFSRQWTRTIPRNLL